LSGGIGMIVSRLLSIRNRDIDKAMNMIPENCELNIRKDSRSLYNDAKEYMISGSTNMLGKIIEFLDRFDCEKIR
jgi:hypothetical protein